MRDPQKFPKLRWPVDIRVDELPDRKVLILHCPLGITEQPLGLTPIVAPLLNLFDGTHSVSDIATSYQKHGATIDIVEQLVALLDQHYFLDSPRFDAENARVRKAFADSDVREPALAGISYSGQAETLGSQIDEYLFHGNSLEIALQGGMLGLVSPHIDYMRGGSAYGIAYSSLRGEQHELYILMGTAHQYSERMFHLSAKDFESPIGRMSCDREFVQKLASLYGEKRSFEDEFLHRREHSLELQIPFLHRMREGATIAPILVGSFYSALKAQKEPTAFEEYETFASALADVIRERLDRKQSLCFLAGVDMAHVGQTFGDPDPLSPDLMETIEQRDREYLAAIEAGDKAALFSHIAEDMDARRVCGFPTMYTILDVCERLGIRYQAQTFDYQQAVNYKTDCAVTFAGMGLYYNPISAIPSLGSLPE